ncbi:cell wall metabolism sensor histidine kinase WalK, partial [Candidatus Nitrosotalea sp. FS]|uniref:cell wall metabolism sensor histidine kinase WalK n=1 Tax=Candidatus Nitrosotalea sp. FS TaxID=2341021 RepID=UPI0014091C9B
MKFLLLLVFAVTIIGASSAYGYEEVSTSDFKIVNSLGEEIKSPVVDQQLNLQTSLKNMNGKNIDWAYIVQVINSDGAIVDLNYATGSLANNQTLAAALSWTPSERGNYKIEIFIWDNLRDINPLAPMS